MNVENTNCMDFKILYVCVQMCNQISTALIIVKESHISHRTITWQKIDHIQHDINIYIYILFFIFPIPILIGEMALIIIFLLFVGVGIVSHQKKFQSLCQPNTFNRKQASWCSLGQTDLAPATIRDEESNSSTISLPKDLNQVKGK